MSKIFSLIIFCAVFSSAHLKKPKVNLYFLVNSSEMSYNDVMSWTKEIFSGSKKMKFQEVKLVHYTSEENQNRGWELNKKNSLSSYLIRPLICEKINVVDLTSILSVYKTPRGNNIMIKCNSDLPLSNEELGMTQVQLSSSTPRDIMSAIDKEIRAIKGSKVDLNLFVYLSKPKFITSVDVRFNENKLEIDYGNEVTIEPVYSKSCKKIKWFSALEMNCDTCRAQKVLITNNEIFVVKVRDKNNCVSDSDTLIVNVNDNCDCNKNETITRPIPDIQEEHIFESGDPIWFNCSKSDRGFSKESISANKSGSPMYFYFMKEFCADRYEVEILDSYGNTIWRSKEYSKQALTTGQIHKDHSGYFIFNLNLAPIKGLIEEWQSSKAFIIKITPIDNKGVKCTPFLSVPTSITPCG